MGRNKKNIKCKECLGWIGTSLVVQWLRICFPNAGAPGSIPEVGALDPTCCN